MLCGGKLVLRDNLRVNCLIDKLLKPTAKLSGPIFGAADLVGEAARNSGLMSSSCSFRERKEARVRARARWSPNHSCCSLSLLVFVMFYLRPSLNEMHSIFCCFRDVKWLISALLRLN